VPISPEDTRKAPAFEDQLPRLLEQARREQVFKVWRGDIPRCEIETKGSVRLADVRVGIGTRILSVSGSSDSTTGWAPISGGGTFAGFHSPQRPCVHLCRPLPGETVQVAKVLLSIQWRTRCMLR
jgi:hypothetical protein